MTIRGKRWLISFCLLDEKVARGFCDPPTKLSKQITIDSRLRGEELVEVVLHEVLHASLWDLDEQAVTETARDAARILAKLKLIDTNE